MLSLCSCGSDTVAEQDVTTAEEMQNEVTTTLPDSEIQTLPSEYTSNTESWESPDEPDDESRPDDALGKDNSIPDSADEDDEEIIEDGPDTKALDILRRLNSTSVHAVFTEIISYDGEYIVSSEREIFISGGYSVFTTDSTKIIIDGVNVTYIDFDDMYYYTYPYNAEEFSNTFGYDIAKYTLIGSEEADGTLTETYSISQYGNEIVSTWVFSSDGSFTVKDVNAEAGSFSYYTFEALDNDFTGMDTSIPDGLTEVYQ